MSSSRPRRVLDARVVALVVASLVAMTAGAVAGFQLRSDDGAPEKRAVSSAPAVPEFTMSPEPETTSLTPASPDESLTEVTPLPEPTGEPSDPSPAPTEDESAPPSSPAPDPSASPSVDVDEELRAFCESAEPFDYWDSAELREVCEEQFGDG